MSVANLRKTENVSVPSHWLFFKILILGC